VEIIINELVSTVEVTSQEALLSPPILRQIVQAVASRMRDEDDSRRWEARERQPWRGLGR
jgi:hypothetical protein